MRPPQYVCCGVYASNSEQSKCNLDCQAEGVGFEPTVGLSPTSVFKTDAFVHSAIPPRRSGEAEDPSECEVLYHRQFPGSIGLIPNHQAKEIAESG